MSFTNAQLAQKISDLIDYWSSFNEEYSNWLGGAVDGGPSSDGQFPLTDYTGAETLVKSPAKLQDDVDNITTGATAQANAAAASAAAALTSEGNAATSESNAETYKDAAAASAAAASVDEGLASSAAVVATTQANLATDRKGYAEEWAQAAYLTPVSVAAGGDGSTDFSAKHWAQIAENFSGSIDSNLYFKLADNEVVTGYTRFQNAAGISIEDAPLSESVDIFFDVNNYYGLMTQDLNANYSYVDTGGGLYLVSWSGDTYANASIPTLGDSISATFGIISQDWNASLADIGFYGDTLFQFGQYVLNADFAFYVTKTTTNGWVYPYAVHTDDAENWFNQFPVHIGAGGGTWTSGSDHVTKSATYAKLEDDTVDFNFTLVGLTDLNFTGMTAVNVPALVSTGAVTGSNLNVSNWDTAYSWGDHAGLYSLVAHDHSGVYEPADATILKDADIGVTVQAFGNYPVLHTTSQAQNYLYLNRNDPVNLVMYVGQIGAGPVARFGKIATAGATSFTNSVTIENNGGVTATGPVTGSNLNVSNWDTAYGWGDHASAGYPSLSANEQITGRWWSTAAAVGGAQGSSMGIQSSNPQFSFDDTGEALDEKVWNLLASASDFKIRALSDDYATANDAITIARTGAAVGNVGIPAGTLELGVYDTVVGGVLKINGTTINKQAELVCTNGNLHIDSNAGQYIYLNYYSNTAGVYFGADGGIKSTSQRTGQYGAIETLGSKGGYGGISFDGHFAWMHSGSAHVGLYNDVNNEWMILGYPNARIGLYYNGTERLQTTSAGANVIGQLDIDSLCHMTDSTGGSLRVTTTHGYVDVGPQNTSWAHFVTDRSNFYFSRPAHFANGHIRYYGQGAYYANGSSSYTSGKVTFSTSAASGGSSGDIWFQYT